MKARKVFGVSLEVYLDLGAEMNGVDFMRLAERLRDVAVGATRVGRLSADEGVNKLLDRFPVRELECPAASIHGDLDTPEDYRQLKDGLGE